VSLRGRLQLSPITWIAVALVVAAVIATVVAILSSRLDNWAPNIATEALSIALTITVVERIVRHEERKRKAPLVNRSLHHINAEFGRFVTVVALDYATTHAASYRPIPRDALRLLRQWLDDQHTVDMPHTPLPPDDENLRDQAREFVRQVDQYEHRDREMLEPDLRAAIRDLWGSLQVSLEWERNIPDIGHDALVDAERWSYRTLIASAHAFGEVLRRYAPANLFEVPEYAIEWAEHLRHERLAEESS
jgi:hypothetical protein